MLGKQILLNVARLTVRRVSWQHPLRDGVDSGLLPPNGHHTLILTISSFLGSLNRVLSVTSC